MAQQSVRVSLPFPDPEYVQFLLKPGIEHDCYFMVGNSKLVKPERIGAVKMMLLAHSPVFRAELQDSKLREKGDVPLGDVYPDTFRHLLRFVYGYDNSSTLTFEEADNLLYAAEKYMMDLYKQKLATRLMALLSADNICSLLNNPACFTVLELDSAITKILQYETDKVLSSPLFLDLTPEGFVKILEQEAMNVAEIEIWRAAIKWAKEQTSSTEGKNLRSNLSLPVKHIRFCTIKLDEFCKEIVPTGVLTHSEVSQVCLFHGTGEPQPTLTMICNLTHARLMKSEIITASLASVDYITTFSTEEQSLDLKVNEVDIELVSLVLPAKPDVPLVSLTYQCDGILQINEKIGNGSNHFSEVVKAEVIVFRKQTTVGQNFELVLNNDGENLRLLANKTYTFKINLSLPHKVFYAVRSSDSVNDHFSVSYNRLSEQTWYYSPIKKLSYRPLAAVSKQRQRKIFQ